MKRHEELRTVAQNMSHKFGGSILKIDFMGAVRKISYSNSMGKNGWIER